MVFCSTPHVAVGNAGKATLVLEGVLHEWARAKLSRVSSTTRRYIQKACLLLITPLRSLIDIEIIMAQAPQAQGYEHEDAWDVDWLRVDETHELYYEQYGQKEGKAGMHMSILRPTFFLTLHTVIYLHGVR